MAGKKIELENHSRVVYHFPIWERAKPPETRPNQLGRMRETGRVKLGDAADRTLPEGVVRDDKRTPNPIVRLTEAQYKALGARNHKLIDALVARGEIVKREVEA